jgi:hypothetical protein
VPSLDPDSGGQGDLMIVNENWFPISVLTDDLHREIARITAGSSAGSHGEVPQLGPSSNFAVIIRIDQRKQSTGESLLRTRRSEMYSTTWS